MARLKMSLLDLCRLAADVKAGCSTNACDEGVNRMIKALTGRSCPNGLGWAKKAKKASRRSRR